MVQRRWRLIFIALLPVLGCSSRVKPPAGASLSLPSSAALRLAWVSPVIPDVYVYDTASFSPDGSQLALALESSVDINKGQQIWLVNAKQASQLTHRFWDRSPEWSPTAQEIAYIDATESKRAWMKSMASRTAGSRVPPPLLYGKLMLLDVTTGATRLLKREWKSRSAPGWSPDGSTFAYIDVTTPGKNNRHLLLLHRNGHLIADIATDMHSPSDRLSPVWTPDEKRIVMWGKRWEDTEEVEGVWEVDTTSRRARWAWQRRHFKSVNQIGFSLHVKAENTNTQQLWMISAKQTKKVTDGYRDRVPDWSPLGEDIAYLTEEKPKSIYQKIVPKLMLMNAVTHASRLLDSKDKSDGGASWSPDGRLLAFLADATPEGNKNTLVLLRPNGMEYARIHTHIDIPRNILPPLWSADGKYIVLWGVHETGHDDDYEGAWLVDVNQRKSQLAWHTNERVDPIGLGYLQTIRKVVFLSRASSNSVALYCGEGKEGKLTELAFLATDPGWIIILQHLMPNGKGFAMEIVKFTEEKSKEPTDSAVLWAYNKQTGRLDFPHGCIATTLAWSRDSKYLAVSVEEQNTLRIAVYKFTP